MERILKEFKFNNNAAVLLPDCYEEISFISYLTGLSEEEIITTEIEAASNIVNKALNNLFEDPYNAVIAHFSQNEQFIVLPKNSTRNNYKIFIRDKWLFQIILINSIKHAGIFNFEKNLLTAVVRQIIKIFIITKPLSLYLLKILLLIVTKRKDTLSPDLSLVVLRSMNEVALSPVTVFRQYARGISKEVIPYLAEESIYQDVSLLPIVGIDTSDIVKHFSEDFVIKNRYSVIQKILRMFSRNVESKDGGVLYEYILFHPFDEWKKEIWPLFQTHLECMNYEGEFFQSFLKYWIAANVSTYQSEFYNYIRKEKLDWKLKAYILLECKKRGCLAPDENCVVNDSIAIFHNIDTKELGLKIAVTFHKKSLWPQSYEFDIVLKYLYSNLLTKLEEDGIKCLNLFLSQIFLFAHSELEKSDVVNLPQYIGVIQKIYAFCNKSLETDYFEVGAEILYNLCNVATGSHKNLTLSYKLEKKDFYEGGDNLFYKKLEEKNLWWFSDVQFQEKLINCFVRNNGSSTYLTKIFTKYLNYLNILTTEDLKNLIQISLLQSSIDFEKRIKNYSEIVFQNHCSAETSTFLEEIYDFFVQGDCFANESLFKAVLYLEIFIIAIRSGKHNIDKVPKVIKKCLSVTEKLIDQKNSSFDINYKTVKIIEAFINNVMLFITENIDLIWNNCNKDYIIRHLLVIVQRSNMKRPLSLSIEALKQCGYKMNENELDKKLKITVLSNTLMSLCKAAEKSNVKIRRNPDSRLVIHAMCISDNKPNEHLLKWAISDLLDIISDTNTQNSAVASALHSIEILISDNNLQYQTLPFVSDVIVQCVEIFARRSWVVRNAALQLTKAVIDRFYGVCLDISNRPKCIENLLVLFPKLSSYFYEILSRDNLDERSILVFQFFSESQVREQISTTEKAESTRKDFQNLFMHILLKYSNHYGKMAAHSYTALCREKEIQKQICSVVYYFKNNFKDIESNIIKNFIFLLKLLFEKYKNSFESSVNEKGIKLIDFTLKELLKLLGNENSALYNFILLKITPKNVILEELPNNLSTNDFTQRLWLNNNISFLLINADAGEIPSVLNKVLSKTMLNCIQIKILSIIVLRFENKEFSEETTNEILEILFEKSFLVDDTNNYLLNCYFKTILVFFGNHSRNKLLQLNPTDSFYKSLIYFLYFSGSLRQLTVNDRQYLYTLIEKIFIDFNYFNTENRNDFLSTIPYLQTQSSQKIKLKLFKILFYSSLFVSTHLEAYGCISTITGKSYSSILDAVKDFFSIQNLISYLKDRSFVVQFFYEVSLYIPSHSQQTQLEGYYTEESDILIPKLFLEKLIYYEIKQL